MTKTTPSKRFLKWQTLTLTLMTVGYAGYYICRSNFSLVLPNIIDELVRKGMSADDAKIYLGAVASISVLGYALAKFFNGALSEFLGGRKGFLLGMLGSVLFTIMFSFSGTIPMFTLAAVANRLFQSMGWINIVKLSSRWFSFSTYGTSMGILSLSFLFGDAIARKTLSSFMGMGFDWRTVYLFSALILLGICTVCFFFLKESPLDIGEEEPPENASNLVGACGTELDLKGVLRILLSNKIFLLTCLLSLGCTLIRETFSTWTTVYFADLGFNQVAAAAHSAWFPFFGGVSVLLAGFISDRLGANGRIQIIAYGLLLCTFVLILLGSLNFENRPFIQVFLVSLIAFVLLGPYSYLGGAMALDLGGKRGSAIASGLIDGVGYLGGFLAGGSIAKISVHFGWSGAFYGLAIMSFISFLGALYFIFEQRKIIAYALTTEESSQ